MRKPEHVARIAHAEREFAHEHLDGKVRGNVSGLLLALQPLTCGLVSGDGHPRLGGQMDMGIELVRGDVVIDAGGQGLADAGEGLSEASALRVAAGDSSHCRHPPACFVALKIDRMSHLRSHPFPKQGSRSRSITRSSCAPVT